MARAIVRRLLHEPTLRLKENEDPYGHLLALRELFALEASPEAEPVAEVTDLDQHRQQRR
jgi:hypothetical protein